MRVLSVETSGLITSCGVYELRGEEIVPLGEVSLSGYLHVRALAPSVDNLLSSLRLSLRDLDAVVTSRGPGFFTSLRIGATFAATLAWTLGLKLLAPDSLRALLASVEPEDGEYLVLYDARKRQLFSSRFSVSDMSLSPIWEFKLLSIDDLKEVSDEDLKVVIYTGNLRDEELVMIYDYLGPEEVIEVEPSARGLVSALLTYEELPVVDPIALRPVYLRPSDAELAKGLS